MGISLIERVCGKVAVPLKMKGLVHRATCTAARASNNIEKGHGATMKIGQNVMTGMMAAALAAVSPAASIPNAPGVPTEMVITVRPASHHSQPENVEASDVKVSLGNTPAPVVGLKRLSGNLADMQLFVLLDDSTRSSSLGIQLPELKTFIEALPAATQVAVGYMRNGSFGLAQAFTADHRKAGSALRLPLGIPGRMAAHTSHLRISRSIGHRKKRPAAGLC
jgi:hypothetical protein